MPSIPLFGIGQKGKSANVSAQQRINLYAEMQQDAEKTRMALYGRAGRSLFATLGDTPIRGGIALDDRLLVVHRGTLWEANNAGTLTSRGTISTTTGRVDMSSDGTVVLITTGTNGYTFTLASNTLAVIPDADFTQTARTNTWLGGFFIADMGAGDQFQISEDGLSWDALDAASAESAPDGLMRVFADHGEIVLPGVATTEFWGITGDADFPFAPVRGSTIEYGLAARWSLTKYDSSLAGLFKNRMGQVQVMRLQGYTPVPMSNPEFDSIINSYATVADATAFSRMQGGHPLYQINFPAAGHSWEYDSLTKLWSEVQYGLNGARDRGEICLDYVNKPRLFDYENGNIYTVDPTLFTDNGTHIRSVLVSRHFFADYNNVIVDRLFVDFEAGVGLVRGPDDTSQNYLNLTGFVGSNTGGYASTPDSVATSITGDIDIRVHLKPSVSWTSTEQYLIGKGTPESLTEYSFYFRLTSAGNLAFRSSATGSGLSGPAFTSTAAVGFTAAQDGWVRVTLDVDNGAAGKTATFYTSTDGVTWTQLGSAVTTAGTTSIYNSTSQVTAALYKAMKGAMYAAYIYDGIGGTLVASMVAANATSGVTSWVSTLTGETWTLNGSASIVNDAPSGIGSDPQVMLRVSRDGGHTYGNELKAAIGKIGQYGKRAEFPPLGVARDFIFELSITDPVKRVIVGAGIDFTPGSR